MPIEKRPAAPLPADFVPEGGVPRRVDDQDNWWSLADEAGVDVWMLIEFNFQTRDPAEVNWYLRRNVGCCRATSDGKNWRFSASASPGIVYLPESILTDPEGEEGLSGEEDLPWEPPLPEPESSAPPPLADVDTATAICRVAREHWNTLDIRPGGFFWFSA